MTITINYLKNLLQYAKAMNISYNDLLLTYKITPALLNNPDERIKVDSYSDIFDALIERSKDAYFGLHFGQNFQFSSLGVLGFMMENSKNGLELYENYIKYESIISLNSRTEIIKTDTTLIVKMDYTEISVDCIYHSYHATMMSHLIGSRKLTNLNIEFKNVYFKTKKSDEKNINELIKHFGNNLNFESDFYGIEFNISDIKKEFNQSIPEIKFYFTSIADKMIAELKSNHTFKSKVSEFLINHDKKWTIGIDDVAAHFAMTVRTFQRQLSLEETSYSAILEGLKKDYALQYLKSKDFTISDIAYMLEFSELSAFTRSFKRWMGKSPVSYRQELKVV